jgi:tyrosine-protein kinase Etk/Wzc
MTSGLSSKTETDGDGSLGAPSNAELGFLMAQLAEKRAQYTDHHPDVRRLKNKIAQVTANLAKHPVSGEQSRPFLAVGNRTLLVREYVNTRDHYEALLNKKFEAALAMNLERQQVESAYKIIDQAFYPLVPVRPRRALIVIVGFFLSLGAGIATVFVRDMMASNATAIIYRNITQIRGPDRRRNAGLVAAHEQAPKELTG